MWEVQAPIHRAGTKGVIGCMAGYFSIVLYLPLSMVVMIAEVVASVRNGPRSSGLQRIMRPNGTYLSGPKGRGIGKRSHSIHKEPQGSAACSPVDVRWMHEVGGDEGEAGGKRGGERGCSQCVILALVARLCMCAALESTALSPPLL